jgi:hypothetical protein
MLSKPKWDKADVLLHLLLYLN